MERSNVVSRFLERILNMNLQENISYDYVPVLDTTTTYLLHV